MENAIKIPELFKEELYDQDFHFFKMTLTAAFLDEEPNVELLSELTLLFRYMETDESSLLFKIWKKALVVNCQKHPSFVYGNFLKNTSLYWDAKNDVERSLFYLRLAHVNNQQLIFKEKGSKESRDSYSLTLSAFLGGEKVLNDDYLQNPMLLEFYQDELVFLEKAIQAFPGDFNMFFNYVRLVSYLCGFNYKSDNLNQTVQYLDESARFLTEHTPKEEVTTLIKRLYALYTLVRSLVLPEKPLPRSMDSLIRENKVMEAFIDQSEDLKPGTIINYIHCRTEMGSRLLKEGEVESGLLFLQQTEKRLKSFEPLLSMRTYLSLEAGLGTVLFDAYISRFEEFEKKVRQSDCDSETLEVYNKEAQEYLEYITEVIYEFERIAADPK